MATDNNPLLQKIENLVGKVGLLRADQLAGRSAGIWSGSENA
jgi:hypothetical protein